MSRVEALLIAAGKRPVDADVLAAHVQRAQILDLLEEIRDLLKAEK